VAADGFARGKGVACIVLIEHVHELADDAATTDDEDENDGRRLFAHAASSGAQVAGSQEYGWIALKKVHSTLFIGCPNISLDGINDPSVLCQSFR